MFEEFSSFAKKKLFCNSTPRRRKEGNEATTIYMPYRIVIWGFAFKLKYKFILDLNKNRVGLWIREVFVMVGFNEF